MHSGAEPAATPREQKGKLESGPMGQVLVRALEAKQQFPELRCHLQRVSDQIPTVKP